jgi:two-component sensor histidine kinase
MIRYLLFCLTLMPFVALAQKQGMAKTDSLLSELNSSRYSYRADTTKVKLLVEIATAYYAVPDSSIKYAISAAQLSQKLEWEHGIAIAYTDLCYAYSTKSDFSTAIDYGQKSLAINEKEGRKKEAISSLGNMSNCYEAQGNYEEALDLNLRALTLAEQINNKPLTGLVMQSLGIIYDQLKNTAKAKQYHLDALKISEQLNDKNNIATVLTNLAQSYENAKDYKGELKSVLRAVAIFEELGNTYALMVATGVAAGCYRNLHKYPQALTDCRKSMRLSKELGSIEYAAISYKGMGEIFFDMARDTSVHDPAHVGHRKYLDSAVFYFEKAITEGVKIGVSDVVAGVHQSLSDAYALKGDYRAALEHHRAYSIAQDSMYSTNSRLKIASLETKRESDLKNKQIEINRLAAIKKRNELLLLLSGLVLLVVIVITLLRAHGRLKKANGEKEILLRQKDDLMKEIHHRVKNNLQVISTLLDLQLNAVTDVNAKSAMTESSTRVRSISLIHQHLYQHTEAATIELFRFTGDLAQQVAAVFKHPGQSIAINNRIPETLLDIDTGISLGLILNELMTNSFKYAFPHGEEGVIEVWLKKHNHNYLLFYKDSGPGMNEAVLANTKSMGMRLIKSLSKQLGGVCRYDAANKTFEISFKDEQERRLID